MIKIFVVVNPDVEEEGVVRKLTRVVSDRHDAGGVKIVVSGPLLADANEELRPEA